jgi:hypothetical protein
MKKGVWECPIIIYSDSIQAIYVQGGINTSPNFKYSDANMRTSKVYRGG